MELLLLLALLASDSVEARDRAAGRLLELGPAAWPALERALDTRDPDLHARVLELLARQPLPEPMLARRSELRDAVRGREVAKLIESIDAKRVERLVALKEWSALPLVSLAEDGRAHPAGRGLAIRALGQIGDRRAIFPLLRLLDCAVKVNESSD